MATPPTTTGADAEILGPTNNIEFDAFVVADAL
jgi:hypothetical protein